MREFMHSSKTNNRLSKNLSHSFAMKYAIGLYNLNAIFSFIPKNACSTLRWSSAISNGVCSINGDANWIHENNRTFNPSLEFTVRAKYAFVVLRCPFRRLVSVYLDKIVDVKPPARKLPNNSLQRVFGKIFSSRTIERLTFSEFCNLISSQASEKLEPHWRPQSDFLLFKNYDDYFCVEEFKHAQEKLHRIGFEVFDTRNQLKHDSNKFDIIKGDFSDISSEEIRKLKSNGKRPTYESFFDTKTRKIVEQIYKNDITLYKEKFGENGNMLFN